jgi:hypothetical protein|tara:strand:+ start:387 stop:917 length:531 start_codon:yes stop_codon:yes gene_type:complete
VTVLVHKLDDNQIDLDATNDSFLAQTYENKKIVFSESYSEDIIKYSEDCDILCLMCTGDVFYDKETIALICKDILQQKKIIYGDTCNDIEGAEKTQYLPPFSFDIFNSGYLVTPLFLPSEFLRSVDIHPDLKFLTSHEIIRQLAPKVEIKHLAKKTFRVPVREIDIKDDIAILNEA